jgi:hypothetical protein
MVGNSDDDRTVKKWRHVSKFRDFNVILKVVARGFGKLKENNEKFSLVLSRCLKLIQNVIFNS